MYSMTMLAGRTSKCTDTAIESVVSADHARLDELFESTRHAVDDEDLTLATQRFTDFRIGMLRHADWEETNLFCACERCIAATGADDLEEHRAEHRELESLMNEILDLLSATIAPSCETASIGRLHDRFDDLEELLGDHFLEEVDRLAKPLDRTLQAERREDLRNALVRRR